MHHLTEISAQLESFSEMALSELHSELLQHILKEVK